MAVDLVVVVLLQFCWLALEALKPSPLLADGFWYGSSCLLCGIGGTAASYVHWGRVSKQSSTSTFLIVVDVGTLMSVNFCCLAIYRCCCCCCGCRCCRAVEMFGWVSSFLITKRLSLFICLFTFYFHSETAHQDFGEGKLQFLKGAYQATLNKMSLRIIKHTTPKNILSVLCRFSGCIILLQGFAIFLKQ